MDDEVDVVVAVHSNGSFVTLGGVAPAVGVSLDPLLVEAFLTVGILDAGVVAVLKTSHDRIVQRHHDADGLLFGDQGCEITGNEASLKRVDGDGCRIVDLRIFVSVQEEEVDVGVRIVQLAAEIFDGLLDVVAVGVDQVIAFFAHGIDLLGLLGSLKALNALDFPAFLLKIEEAVPDQVDEFVAASSRSNERRSVLLVSGLLRFGVVCGLLVVGCVLLGIVRLAGAANTGSDHQDCQQQCDQFFHCDFPPHYYIFVSFLF